MITPERLRELAAAFALRARASGTITANLQVSANTAARDKRRSGGDKSHRKVACGPKPSHSRETRRRPSGAYLDVGVAGVRRGAQTTGAPRSLDVASASCSIAF